MFTKHVHHKNVSISLEYWNSTSLPLLVFVVSLQQLSFLISKDRQAYQTRNVSSKMNTAAQQYNHHYLTFLHQTKNKQNNLESDLQQIHDKVTHTFFQNL